MREDSPITSARPDTRLFAAIFAGGVVGALVRVGLAEAFPHGAGGWPWATFAVNMLGALALGFITTRFHDRREEDLAHPFLTVGLCGTLTTFATVQLELFEMVDAGRVALALLYAAITISVGYALLRLGVGLGRRPEAA